MVQHCLEQLGHTVTTAADGLEGLETARAGSFDIIILDVDMPHMNGLEVLQHLRNDDAFSQTFIAMLTAEAADQMIVQGYNDGVNMYLTKPISPAALAQAFK